MPKAIVVVEDDESIREMLRYYFQSVGYAVRSYESGEALFQEEEGESLPALYILDIMLPGMDGLEILRRLRSGRDTGDIPVIMLTARTAEMDRVSGLEAGADDYVVKPFSMAELSAKIMSFLRRSKGLWEKNSIEAYDIVIYPDKLQVFVSGKELRLAPKEYAMLKYFMEHRGILVTRDDLLLRLWGYDYEGSDRVVDNHIKKLRQALGESGKQIKTVFAKGYRMD